MLVLTRDIALQGLLQIPSLVNLYASRDPEFVSACVRWMVKLEDGLRSVNSSTAAFVATERARVLAATEGGIEPQGAVAVRISPRRAQQADCISALARIDASLQSAVARIDATLDPLLEKMAQLVAIASASHAIPLQGQMSREEWLRNVWDGLFVSDAAGMHRYLASALSPVDRLSLLENIISNFLSSAKPVWE